jgi:hypothetical protein
VIDERWVLKLTDFGLEELRGLKTVDFGRSAVSDLNKLLYIAPEHLPDVTDDSHARLLMPVIDGSQSGDIYRFVYRKKGLSDH